LYKTGFFTRFAAWTTSLAILLTLVWPAGYAQAYTEVSRTSYQEPIAEGVTAQWLTIQTTDGPMNVYVLTVDLSNPYVRIDSMVGTGGVITKVQNVTNMAKENGAVAAINGDFFNMQEDAPMGLIIKSGELVSSPIQRTDMYGFGLTKGNTPIFPVFSFEGSVTSPTGVQFPLFGINKPTYLAYLADKNPASDANRLNMYTPRWGLMSRGALPNLKGVTEMVVDNNIVREFRVDQPGTVVPPNGFVLVGQGTSAQYLTANFKVGDQVQVSYRVSPETDNLNMAIGGMALTVDQGKRHWFTQTVPGRTAGTSIGASQDGKTLYLAAVDGGKTSRGMTQAEMADFMVSIGAWTAINLDGGGSTTVAARRLGDQNVSLLNDPVNTVQRAVPDALGIFSTAPAGPLAGIIVTGPQNVLIGLQKTFNVKGYDEHYNPSSINPGDVTWEIDPAMGSFQGSTLYAKGPGKTTVKAVYDGFTKEYPVTILGGGDIAKIDVNPARIAVNPGESVAVSAKITTKTGSIIALQPGEFQLQLTDGLGTVKDNNFTASDSMAVGELTVKVDTASTTIRVSVGGVEKPFYNFDTAKTLKFKALPADGATGSFRYTQGNEPVFRGAGAARLAYDFSATSDLRIAYGDFDQPLALPGQPLGLGLWVNGDAGNGHWLRARVVDATGKEKLLNFAENVDWKGWKHVIADIPFDVKYPVNLTDIYLVANKGDTKDIGELYFDELSLLNPATPDDIGSKKPEAMTDKEEVAAGNTGILQFGTDFTVSLTNPQKTGYYSVLATQVWDTQLPTPGYNPVMPLYEITGEKDGDSIPEFPTGMKIQVNARNVPDMSKARVMKWDEQTGVWVQIPQVIDAGTGVITAKTNKFGLLGLMTDARPAPVFNDTAASWAKDLIGSMAARKIVSGYPDGKFMPEKGVTRAEFVTLLANTMGWSTGAFNISFKDDIPMWARGSIGAAVNQGVVKGYDDGTFKPEKVINRAEMAAIVDKALALPNSSKPSNYKDAKQIPAWAVQSIRNTKVSGVITGALNKFRPKDIANRAEATAVMAKILDYYVIKL
jgi:hypothetical protein